MADVQDWGGNDFVLRGIRPGYDAPGVASTKTATAVSNAATLNKMAGKITTEALTTAAAATYTLTLTNNEIAAADQVYVSVAYGTATAGAPVVQLVTPAAGSVVIILKNVHASSALDGTLKISFLVVKN